MAANASVPVQGGKRGAAAAISIILAAVFAIEGGFVDDPNDPGGATNHGITEAVAREAGYRGDMRRLTADDAERIVLDRYIDRPGYAKIAEYDPAVAFELIDSGVNAGPSRPSRWLQESLNSLNYRAAHWPEIAEDGAVGQGTLGAYRALQLHRGARPACEVLVKMLDAKQAGHYLSLARDNNKFETFVFGWFRRVGSHDAPVRMADGSFARLPDCSAARPIPAEALR